MAAQTNLFSGGIYPLESDIILGRGAAYAKHPGNRRFYSVVDAFLPFYRMTTAKSEKTDMIALIYDEIAISGQRFLKEKGPASTCQEVSKDQAKKKIGHTLRYRLQKRTDSKTNSVPRTAFGAQIQSPSSPIRSTAANAVVTPLPATYPGHVDIIPDEQLDSVLGLPGEMDLSNFTPTTFMLHPHIKESHLRCPSGEEITTFISW